MQGWVGPWLGLVLGLCSGLAAGSARAQDFSDVSIETLPVAGSVSMLTGRGGNIGVSAGPDGVFLIDDQFAPLTEKIRAAVAALGAGEIRFVLNTHWHGDHTGGNENLGKAGVVIVSHGNVRVRMSSEQTGLRGKTPASPPAALPVITFDDAITFWLNGDEVHAFHVAPAHTDGDSVVHFRKANVIHAGDLFFNGIYPFIDIASGGSIVGVLAAVDLLLELCDAGTKIIPGHGPPSDRAGLQRYRQMLSSVHERVSKAVAAGQGADALVASAPLADLDADWGGGFLNAENFLRIVHADLSAGR